MKKITSIFTLIAMAFAIGGNALAYDNFVADTQVSATINSEKIGILDGGITSGDTTITLETGHSLANGKALIGDEIVDITATTATTATVTRAGTHTHADSVVTVAAPHSDGVSIRNIVQNIDIVFTPTTALVATDKVIITIPNDDPNTFGAMGSVTLPATGVTTDTSARTFTITGLTGTGAQTVEIQGVENPEIEGQYGIPVEIRSVSDSLLELGLASLAWANEVLIRAIIQPALILTIDKSAVDIIANPTVNTGENYSQKSVLSVSTNALNGYKISAKLEGKYDNAAELQADTDGDLSKDYQITSGDAMSTENTFGYVAYNGDGSLAEQTVDVAGRLAMNNEVTRLRADIKTDADSATAFANTDTPLLPVTNLGAVETPGAGITELAYDSFINLAKHTIYYLLNIDYQVPSGEYGGTVTYTATPSF